MKYFKKFILALFAFTTYKSLTTLTKNTCCNNSKKLNKKMFNYLTYSELVELSKSGYKNEYLKYKVNLVLNSPIIDNSIQTRSNIELQNNAEIGEYIRIASWNINRSINTDNIKSIFVNPDLFVSNLKTKNPKIVEKVKKQAEILKYSDVIILNEVDAGMPRSGYKRVIEELGKAIGYNYAYGVEFLEVDPVQLGLEDYKLFKKKELLGAEGIEKFEVDRSKYRGLHGNAILSRFPIENVRILRLPQPYDWYNSEKEKPRRFETIRRYISRKLFKEGVTREIRIGGRMALIADIIVPQLNTPITVVSTHLENRTSPKYRNEQVKSILDNIKDLDNPVVLAGDFNTSCYYGGPTSDFFAKALIPFINPIFATMNILRKYSNPTVKHIPIIFPNKESELFDTIRKAEFCDCKPFGFRVRKKASSNCRKCVLSYSNEKNLRGFKPTFAFERSFGLAKYKLDWIFVKSNNNILSKNGTSKLARLRGRTLYELNYIKKGQLSDHAPITVDIPFQSIKKQDEHET